MIMEQVRTFTVMMAAGVFVESIWQIRSLFLQRLRRAGGDSWQLRQSHPAGGGGWQSAHPLARAMVEILFWSVTTLIISMFLYYCAWGKLSVQCRTGIFHGSFVVEKNVLCYNQNMGKNRRSKEFKNNSQVIDMEEARCPAAAKKACRERKKGRKGAARQTAEHQRQASHPQKQDPEKNNNGDHDRDHRPFSVPLVFNIISLKKEQYDTKKEQQALKQQKAELQKELENAETPENIEAQARQQLRLIKPGEVLYMFPSEITDRDDSSTGGQKGDSSQ